MTYQLLKFFATKEIRSGTAKRCFWNIARLINLSLYSGRGPEPGQLDFPVDATFMADGSIAVCDKNNMRIQVRLLTYSLYKVTLFYGHFLRNNHRGPSVGKYYLNDCSNGLIAIAISSWQLCRGWWCCGDLTISALLWIVYSPLVVIRKIAVAIGPCEQCMFK